MTWNDLSSIETNGLSRATALCELTLFRSVDLRIIISLANDCLMGMGDAWSLNLMLLDVLAYGTSHDVR